MPDTGLGPNDPNWVYYIARTVLVLLWLLASYRALVLSRDPRRGHGIWLVVSPTCLYLAILRATRFDWSLKFWAQAQAETRGLEEIMRVGEIALLGLILAAMILLLVFYVRQVGRDQGAPALALVAGILMVLFTMWETFSLDELIPAFLLSQLLGRYPLEGALVMTVLWGTRRH